MPLNQIIMQTIVESGKKLEILYENFTFTKETLAGCQELAHQIARILNTRREIKKQSEFLKLSLSEKTEFLRYLAVTCEVADIFGIMNREGLEKGIYQDNYQKIHNFSVALFEEIERYQKKSIPDEKTNYFRQVVRCSLVSINEDYRLDNYTDCIEKISFLVAFIEAKLVSKNIDCYETLARLNYYLGKNQRKRGRIAQAELSYKKSLICLKTYAESISYEPRENTPEESATIARRIQATHSKCGIVETSRAWLFFDKGDYASAEHSAITALALLANTQHLIIKNHALLILGTIKRVKSTTFEEMQEAIDLLMGARKAFVELEHKRLLARTDYELVLGLLIQDNLMTGRNIRTLEKEKRDFPVNIAKKLLAQCSWSAKPLWKARYSILKSKISRKLESKKNSIEQNYNDAIRYAEDSIKEAENKHDIYSQIDGRVALGEAYLGKGRKEKEIASRETDASKKQEWESAAESSFQSAKEWFSSAIGKNKDGVYLQLEAICRLLMARVAINLEDEDEFNQQFHEYQKLGPFQQYWVAQLEKRIRTEKISLESKKLTIDLNNLHHSHYEAKLRRVLLEAADKQLENKNEKVTNFNRGKLLGVGESTIRNWLRDLEIRENNKTDKHQ